MLLADLLEGTAGRIAGLPRADRFTSFTTDSTRVEPGGLFFALRGSRTDGHRFVSDAVRRGAAGVVVSQCAGDLETTVVQVADTWAALYDLARWKLRQVRPTVVGITGSNGKTTTKEMTAAVLGARYEVHKTPGNLNSETGVPLTILQLEPRHRYLVLEMGMHEAGEIARLAELARPSIGVITMIGSVNMEWFATREALARAKGELVQALPPNGLAILNADNPFTPLLASLTAAPVTTFGLEAGDLRAEGYRARADGCEFTVEGVRVRLGLPGRHQVLNALAALAVGRRAGVPLEEGARAVSGVRVIGSRFRQTTAAAGYRVVDDTYNASPESMMAAFQTVAEARGGGQLLAVLGEMVGLGEVAELEHRRVGAIAGATFDAVCVVDEGIGAVLAEAAGAELVPDRAAAVRWLERRARAGDLVLVKGSRTVELDRVVEALGEGEPGPDAGPMRALGDRGPLFRQHVRETPLLVYGGDHRPWRELLLKDETRQVTGAFKFRGNLHRLLCLPPSERVVTTASTGNHGVGLATAARLVGIQAHVFVPATASEVKLLAIAETGATMTTVDGDYEQCKQASLAFAAESGARYVSGFDDRDVIAGNGSVFAEADAQRPDGFETVFVPVGGGGLLAACLEHYRGSGVSVVGVELDTAPSMRRSLAWGSPLPLDEMSGRAEGLLIRQVGEVPFEIARSVADLEIRLVSDAQIDEAIRLLWRHHGIRAEGAGAAALAGALDCAGADRDQRALVIVSGGNIDERLFWKTLEETVPGRSAGA